jgi:hypothetical protein
MWLPYFLIGLFGLFELGLLYAFWKWRNSIRTIESTEISRIKDLFTGTVEVEGEARPAASEELRSPWMGKSCCYYHFEVHEYRGGKNSSWVKIIDDKQPATILVEDPTGRVAVDIARARVILRPDDHIETGSFSNPSEPLENVLRRYSKSARNFLGFGKKLRLTEMVIEPGDKLYVLGHAEPGIDTRWTIGRGGPAFLVSDQPEHSVLGQLRKESYGFLLGAILVPAVGAFLFWLINR